MIKKILTDLQEMGDEHIVSIWKKHGASNEHYGASLAKVKNYSKNISKDNTTAENLWNTKVIDSMILATLICKPRYLAKQQINDWLNEIDFYLLVDIFVNNVASRSNYAVEFMRKWTASDNEFVVRAGYMLLGKLASKAKSISDDEFKVYLEIIRKNIHNTPNRAREAMNAAVIAIGKRNRMLNRFALIIANNIGVVDVDHGETNCKTPFAPEILSDKKITSKLYDEVQEPEELLVEAE